MHSSSLTAGRNWMVLRIRKFSHQLPGNFNFLSFLASNWANPSIYSSVIGMISYTHTQIMKQHQLDNKTPRPIRATHMVWEDISKLNMQHCYKALESLSSSWQLGVSRKPSCGGGEHKQTMNQTRGQGLSRGRKWVCVPGTWWRNLKQVTALVSLSANWEE